MIKNIGFDKEIPRERYVSAEKRHNNGIPKKKKKKKKMLDNKPNQNLNSGLKIGLK